MLLEQFLSHADRRDQKLNRFSSIVVSALLLAIAGASPVVAQQIHVGFLWHMHQPIYYPYESIIATDNNNRFGFSVADIHNQRFGPYNTWPKDAIDAGSGLWHLGAQVSFSGSLIENLNNLQASGINGGMWNNWDWAYDAAQSNLTQLGNRRLEMVAFGYFHPLMPLLDEEDIRMQIRLHEHIYAQTWSGGSDYSAGMFPPETAFSARMIPALVAEGIDWVLVDNIHFDRACQGYPYTSGSNLYPPNPADQINADPAASGGAWVQLQNLWAPSRVSAPFGYQPHYVQHVDPETGTVSKMIAVPAARYEGNEDGRGGYGAFLYDQVMDAFLPYNTDASHPMFVMLHHDGDNYGGGSESYYHYNFQNMVSWVSGDSDYDVTTVNDYLDRFPPAASDVIHVEDGSWAGADNGDPEFKKWLGDPDGSGWSPDRNSWAVLTAAKNRVFMAEQIAPATNSGNIISGVGSSTEQAWHYLLVSESSDYWYWDGTYPWDNNVTRGCNQAVLHADAVISGQPDNTPPTIFLPQRDPYNPGGYEWGASPEPSDFTVWTYAYDVSGLTDVTLYYRADLDGTNALASTDNETYAGGADVSAWESVGMTAQPDPPPATGIISATYKAQQYAAMIMGKDDVLIDYYVSATDIQGNVRKSPIQHVYVGQTTSGGTSNVSIDPETPTAGEQVTISYDATGGPLAAAGAVYLHYGFNGWNPTVNPDSAMTYDAQEEVWAITVPVASSATMLDLVFNDGAGTWDNNSGADWHFAVGGGSGGESWTIDGALDIESVEVASNGMFINAGVIGNELYVATNAVGAGNDHFLFLADNPGALQNAPWSKAGQVAGWSAFLASENDNGWAGWFDAAGATQISSGSVLEGTINLVDEFGTMPERIYLAVGPWETSDGGALYNSAQAPASVNNDGNLDAAEFVEVSICSITIGGGSGSAGDLNGDCLIDLDDYDVFAQCLAGPGNGVAPNCPPGADADFNDDGSVDLRDCAELQRLMTP